MKYHKIQSLWKREDITKKQPRHRLIPGDYALDEFGLIKKWEVQEKIDGTNIRIHFYQEDGLNKVEFFGRGDNATIPKHLMKYLREHFTVERLTSVFQIHSERDVYLFGEGYGPKIQAGGGNYREDAGFILFDIYIKGFWLKQEDVKPIAASLEVPHAPLIGVMTEQEIIDYVKSFPKSLCSKTEQVMEGVVCRAVPSLYNDKGERMIFKLKCVDFE